MRVVSLTLLQRHLKIAEYSYRNFGAREFQPVRRTIPGYDQSLGDSHMSRQRASPEIQDGVIRQTPTRRDVLRNGMLAALG